MGNIWIKQFNRWIVQPFTSTDSISPYSFNSSLQFRSKTKYTKHFQSFSESGSKHDIILKLLVFLRKLCVLYNVTSSGMKSHVMPYIFCMIVFVLFSIIYLLLMNSKEQMSWFFASKISDTSILIYRWNTGVTIIKYRMAVMAVCPWFIYCKLVR